MNLREMAMQANVGAAMAPAPAALVGAAKEQSEVTERQKKVKAPRPVIDDNWINGLQELANAEVLPKVQQQYPNIGAITLVPKRNTAGDLKGLIPVLTVDGQEKRASAVKTKVSVCSNGNTEAWMARLIGRVDLIMSAGPTPGVPRGRWKSLYMAVTEQGYTAKVAVGKLVVSKSADFDRKAGKVSLHVNDGTVVVTSATGPLDVVSSILSIASDSQVSV